MEKPEYGDLYKFIASVGVVLISLSLVFPWLMLRESFDVFHKASEISEMTQTAQEVIAYRQSTALWWVQNVGYFSAALATVGLITLGVGIYLWRTKQKVADKKEDLEIAKLEKELKPMPPEQIAEKTIKEAEESVVDTSSLLVPLTEEDREKLSLNWMWTVSDVFNFERIIAEKLAGCFSNARVLTNQEIGRTEYDIILQFDPGNIDIIFNIKYRKNYIDSKTIVDTTNQSLVSLHTYQRNTLRKANVIMLFIVSEPGITQDELTIMIQAQLTEEDRALLGISARFIKPEDIDNISCGQLRGMITPGYLE